MEVALRSHANGQSRIGALFDRRTLAPLPKAIELVEMENPNLKNLFNFSGLAQIHDCCLCTNSVCATVNFFFLVFHSGTTRSTSTLKLDNEALVKSTQSLLS